MGLTDPHTGGSELAGITRDGCSAPAPDSHLAVGTGTQAVQLLVLRLCPNQPRLLAASPAEAQTKPATLTFSG